jgi:hypothetical protein
MKFIIGIFSAGLGALLLDMATARLLTHKERMYMLLGVCFLILAHQLTGD